MPDETIKPRLDAITDSLAQAADALEKCRADLDIAQHIESANAREIKTLKRHVAKLQADSRERGA